MASDAVVGLRQARGRDRGYGLDGGLFHPPRTWEQDIGSPSKNAIGISAPAMAALTVALFLRWHGDIASTCGTPDATRLPASVPTDAPHAGSAAPSTHRLEPPP